MAFASRSFSTSHRHDPEPAPAQLLDEVRAPRIGQRSRRWPSSFGVTLQTVRRDVKLLADAGLLARFHGGVRMPSSTTENIAYRQRQQLNAQAKRRIARAVAAARAARLLADDQHRHHHRGDRARAAAPQGPARDHQQPERRGDPVRQPATARSSSPAAWCARATAASSARRRSTSSASSRSTSA